MILVQDPQTIINPKSLVEEQIGMVCQVSASDVTSVYRSRSMKPLLELSKFKPRHMASMPCQERARHSTLALQDVVALLAF